MNVELHESHLLDRFQQVAGERTQSAEQLLEVAGQTSLDKRDREALHADTEVFWGMRKTWAAQYVGQYGAIYQGKVIDTAVGARRSEQRIRDRFGPAPVLIAPVWLGSLWDLRWHGGRLERLEA